ncbi:MAG: hypothetical protein ACX94B_06505 [Henriciella sp.]|nr:hypothetical protein [Hyphomonadaceae bacterium]
MQATTSHVSSTRVSTPSVHAIHAIDSEPAAYILPALKQEAKASGRDHLLVRRRRRDRRQSSR